MLSTSDVTKPLVVMKRLIKLLQGVTVSTQAKEYNRRLRDRTKKWSSSTIMQKSKAIPKVTPGDKERLYKTGMN